MIVKELIKHLIFNTPSRRKEKSLNWPAAVKLRKLRRTSKQPDSPDVLLVIQAKRNEIACEHQNRIERTPGFLSRQACGV